MLRDGKSKESAYLIAIYPEQRFRSRHVIRSGSDHFPALKRIIARCSKGDFALETRYKGLRTTVPLPSQNFHIQIVFDIERCFNQMQEGGEGSSL